MTAPNRVWVANIIYLWIAKGWLHLVAATLDLVGRRNPAPELLYHFDQDSQYGSAKYRALLGTHGMSESMSRRGNC